MANWIMGADISHYQSRPDISILVDGGVKFLIAKATEGLHTDPDFEWARNEATTRSLAFFAYPFLRPNDDDDTIKNFLRVTEKAIPALDWEAAGTPAEDVERWMDLIEADLGRDGLAYRGKWPPEPVTERIQRWPWWYPQYPSDSDAAPRVPVWDGTGSLDWSKKALIWQYTEHGRIPGLGVNFDLDRLACPWELFKEWYDTGKWPGPTITKTPEITSPISQSAPIERLLRLHSSGEDVWTLQDYLDKAGYQLDRDGEFGGATLRAVEDFQAGHQISVDGVVGPRTVQALQAVIQA